MKNNFYVTLSILGIIGGIVTITSYSMFDRGLLGSAERVVDLSYVSILVGSTALVGSILFYRCFVHSKLITMIAILFSIILICSSLYFIVNGEELREFRVQYFALAADAMSEEDPVIRKKLIEEAREYSDKSFIKSYNPLLILTKFFGIFYLLFSIYSLSKVKSSNKQNE